MSHPRRSVLVTLFLALAAHLPCQGLPLTPDANTWALYHFDGDFLDSSGNGRNLTVENPRGYLTFAQSRPGRGMGDCLYITQADARWSNQTRIYSSQLRYPGSGSWTVEATVFVPQQTTASP